MEHASLRHAIEAEILLLQASDPDHMPLSRERIRTIWPSATERQIDVEMARLVKMGWQPVVGDAGGDGTAYVIGRRRARR
jgi:hypothetical protein